MKKIAAIILAVLFGAYPVFAHHPEGGSTAGLFGLKAEYVHVLLNPLPVYGLTIGILVLAAGLISRSKAARNIGLAVIVLCAVSAWPVLVYGQHAYNHLYPQLDTDSQQWLDAHMERAEKTVYSFYLTAILGIGTLLVSKKFPRAATALTGFTLAMAVASLGFGAWISRAGGEVSHSEFRNDDTPPPVSTQHHEHSEEMNMPNLGGTHPADAPTAKPTEKAQIPNTPEGIWQEIHKHQSALESSVQNKNLDEIHPHAVAVKELTTALVNVVHPDHKAAVQSGADKINLAVSDLHKAAHADDQAAAETSLKRFDEAVKQLEEQMSKQ